MLSTSITNIARTLRREQTEDESLLWQYLRNRKLDGLKFLRQHPIIYDDSNGRKEFYVVDFYCASRKLIIELDGAVHNKPEQCIKDADREKKLRMMGYRILRIRNEELRDMDLVLEKIRRF